MSRSDNAVIMMAAAVAEVSVSLLAADPCSAPATIVESTSKCGLVNSAAGV